MDFQFVPDGNRRADRLDRRVGVQVAMPRLDFLDDHQLVVVLHLDRERGAVAHPQSRVGGIDRLLDVFRIVVPPANNDQVLQPAGHEKLLLADEPQVAGPQERAFAATRSTGGPGSTGCPGQAGVKGCRGGLRVFVVAVGHAGALDPDFPDLPVRDGEGASADRRSESAVAAQVLAASHQDAASGVLGRADLDLVAGKRIGLDGQDDGRSLPRTARNHERGFGQSIAGEERLPAEPAGGEDADELLDRLRADPLGPQERHLPAAQIQSCPLLGEIFRAQRS